MNYVPVKPTEEQKNIARASELYKLGDLMLVWVQESDLINKLDDDLRVTTEICLDKISKDAYNEGLEQAAKWHDEQAKKSYKLALEAESWRAKENWDYDTKIHKLHAKYIRSMIK